MPRIASDLSFAQRPVPPPRLCPVCASEVDITSRHVTVQGSAVRNGAPSLLTEAAPGVVRGAAPKRSKSGRSRRERVKAAPTAAEPTPSEDSAPEALPTGPDR